MSGINDTEENDLERETLALPREIEAPRGLWAGIEARIEAKRRRSLVVRRSVTGASMLLAAAAVILSVRAARQPHEGRPVATIGSDSPRVAPSPSAPPEPVTPVAPEEVTYRAAVAALEPTFETRMKSLPEKELTAVGASIRTLDAAIGVTRASLLQHPDDVDLRGELDAEYEQKIDAMNDVLEWTTRS